ncbi:hypothetical protein [Yinghuangia seranimata]|uniref:hypothetical protein n=1 Tax=Yinghuangia seranimata TaxID=408067 RepID=UPI00248D0257|nr:hypothetical protein [Yinghuangia seranimata]MDI2130393.1 hypothetical protein [Yinghuangia seranimata]
MYDVVIRDALGHPVLGFRDGTWFHLPRDLPPRAVGARTAILGHPEAAGPIVQVMCWWMREHPAHGHAVDLATELALLVGDMSRGLTAPPAVRALLPGPRHAAALAQSTPTGPSSAFRSMLTVTPP